MAEALGNGSGNVTYSVKELLSRIDSKIDNISAQINLKADQVQIEHIILRLTRAEEDIAGLDKKSAVTDALRGQIKWLVTLGVTLTAAIIANGIINWLQWTGRHA